jgi:hypothetical protein
MKTGIKYFILAGLLAVSSVGGFITYSQYLRTPVPQAVNIPQNETTERLEKLHQRLDDANSTTQQK